MHARVHIVPEPLHLHLLPAVMELLRINLPQLREPDKVYAVRCWVPA